MSEPNRPVRQPAQVDGEFPRYFDGPRSRVVYEELPQPTAPPPSAAPPVEPSPAVRRLPWWGLACVILVLATSTIWYFRLSRRETANAAGSFNSITCSSNTGNIYFHSGNSAKTGDYRTRREDANGQTNLLVEIYDGTRWKPVTCLTSTKPEITNTYYASTLLASVITNTSMTATNLNLTGQAITNLTSTTSATNHVATPAQVFWANAATNFNEAARKIN